MKNLTLSQQENYEQKLKIFSLHGIEIGKVIELWKYPYRYNKNGNILDPKNDSKNGKNYLKYSDQFGVFHSALLFENHFVMITEIEPELYCNNIFINVIAKEGDTKFRFYGNSFPVEWLKFDNEIEYFLDDVFCFAEQAYNTNILTLGKNGERPVPKKPIVVCEKHDFAYHENRFCEICKNEGLSSSYPDWNKPKINPVGVSILNKGIYTLVK